MTTPAIIPTFRGGSVWKHPSGGRCIVVMAAHDSAGALRMQVVVFGAPGNMSIPLCREREAADELERMHLYTTERMASLLTAERGWQFVGYGLDLLDAEECGMRTRMAVEVLS